MKEETYINIRKGYVTTEYRNRETVLLYHLLVLYETFTYPNTFRFDAKIHSNGCLHKSDLDLTDVGYHSLYILRQRDRLLKKLSSREI